MTKVSKVSFRRNLEEAILRAVDLRGFREFIKKAGDVVLLKVIP